MKFNKMVRIITLFSLTGILVLSGHGLTGEMKKAPGFTLKDYNGKTHSLSDFSDSKAIVVMFIATQCPVSNDYNSRMVELYEDYNNKNVTFLGINSNKQESIKEIAGHAEDNGFQFPVLKDDKNVVADEYEAQVTPEIFVISPKMEIFYHGRIDDSRRQSEVKNQDLRNALDAILAGESVDVTETKAFGCTIKRVNK